MGEHHPLPYEPELIDRLPGEITDLTGAIREVRLPQQGVCNLLLLLEAERDRFALKISRGSYRSQELWAEHIAMQGLLGSDVPVPGSIAFVRQGDLGFQLRPYSAGEPVSALLADGAPNRRILIQQMGQTLAAIHRVRPDAAWSWEQWVEASLERAALNLAAGVGDDPEEFPPEKPAGEVLEWLHSHRPPGGGTVCLLHGDYRPKNLLWEAGHVTSVIDWAFVDIGDPYYDLSIVHWYMQNETEWEQFLAAYGLGQFDRERFDFCMTLHKFLNM